MHIHRILFIDTAIAFKERNSSMFVTYVLVTLLAFFSKVIADVSISKPTSGQTFAASGGTVTVPLSWIESQSTPQLSQIEQYRFTICTGPNSNINGIDTLDKVSASDITDNSYNLQIPASIGTNGNYFVQIYAVTKDGGYTIHYTYRFALTGMTGTLAATGSDVNPPSAEVNVANAGVTTTMSPEELSKSFAVYYTSQTGKTRYAPMQTQPGSSVSATTWTRRYPTSAVTYYSTVKNSLDQVSTITPGWSYTISSAINWATPAPFPSANGGWYNPSSKVTPASLSSLSSSQAASSSS